MKVHIQQIPPEGLRVEGKDPSSILDLRESGIRPVSSVEYSLEVGLSEGGLFATGRVGVNVELQCVSCLEHFEQAITVEDFACQVELTSAETVDLTEPVREDILLALPAHPHCDWSGERVCQGVPADALLLSETEILAPEVWGALDQLKLN